MLTPGGYVIFDYSSPRVLREDWRSLDGESVQGNYTLRRRHRYDDLLDRSETHLQLLVNGTVVWTEVHHQYVYDTYELYRAASRARLSILSVRSLDSTTFTPDCTTHVYVMRTAP